MSFLSGLLLSCCTHFPKGHMLLFFSGNIVYLHFLSFLLPTFLKLYLALTSSEFYSADFLFNISCELFVTKKSPCFRFLPPLPDSHVHENSFSFFFCPVGSQPEAGWTCPVSGCMLVWCFDLIPFGSCQVHSPAHRSSRSFEFLWCARC